VFTGTAEITLRANGLRRKDPSRSVDTTLARNLSSRGDRRLLGALLDYLLSNAWKFTKKRDAAHVEFGIIPESEAPVYFVRDNGCGFKAPQDMAQVFLPFQRSHKQEEYPGTGISLATVKRIIAHHGGKVWAESAVGKGTTFCFTLPG
jgi:light-regulated signal transduction histidine kinase (bacteriophytochrome)